MHLYMPIASPSTVTNRPYYGWWIVVVCLVAALVGNALGLFGAGIYLHAITETKGWPVGRVSGAVTLFYVVSALLLISGFAASAGGVRRRECHLRVNCRQRNNAFADYRSTRVWRRVVRGGFRNCLEWDSTCCRPRTELLWAAPQCGRQLPCPFVACGCVGHPSCRHCDGRRSSAG